MISNSRRLVKIGLDGEQGNSIYFWEKRLGETFEKSFSQTLFKTF